MDSVEVAAENWLQLSTQLGWGVEGPGDASEVSEVVRKLAEGHDPSRLPPLLTDDRDLGTRPVDALVEAARLLVEAQLVSSAGRRDELVSAARGWLRIAAGR